MQELFNAITTAAVIIAISTSLSSVLVTIINSKMHHKETAEIESDVQSVVDKIKNSENVIDLMMKNVAELREYYVISKQQARKSFMAALVICILGFVIFALGIISSYLGNPNVVSLTTISGSIVEIISGLFFFMYKNSL
ncbi:MAG: hypothetical protein K2J80_10050, partial [Oscillospiraceae bacterium]|nr:hypothetical protein [Oscillospiraceae bacterium]